MARNKLGPLGEISRKDFRRKGWIDDRYKDGAEGVKAKDGRRRNKWMKTHMA